MKIYDCEGFPNPARVRIALAEKGATNKVQFIHVDVMKGEHRSPNAQLLQSTLIMRLKASLLLDAAPRSVRWCT